MSILLEYKDDENVKYLISKYNQIPLDCLFNCYLVEFYKFLHIFDETGNSIQLKSESFDKKIFNSLLNLSPYHNNIINIFYNIETQIEVCGSSQACCTTIEKNSFIH